MIERTEKVHLNLTSFLTTLQLRMQSYTTG